MDNIRKIFSRLNLKVKDVSEVNTFYNSLAKVHTDNGNFFLKTYNDRTGYKLSNLYPLLEKWVPVPKVLKYDESCSIIDKPYLIISEVHGQMLCNTKVDSNFYHEFGKMLAKIHSLTFNNFGETFDGKTVESYHDIPSNKNWKDFYKQIINKRLDRLKSSYFEDLIGPINEWFDNHLYLLDYNITPRLLHEDLNQKNIFVKENRITGIIDFDGAFIGHNEEELMRTEGANFSDNEFRMDFLKGYTEIIDLDTGYEKRRRFYYLSRLLVHIACVIQNGQGYVGDLQREQEILREEINKIIKGHEINFDKNRVNT